MHTIACFSIDEGSSIDLSLSLAAILGLLAQKKTLLIDFGDMPNLVYERLGLTHPPNLLDLLERYLPADEFDTVDISAFSMPFNCPESWGSTDSERTFHLLPGPPATTQRYANLLKDDFPALVLDRLIASAEMMPYEYLVIHCDHARVRKWAQVAIEKCDGFVVRANDEMGLQEGMFVIDSSLIRSTIHLPKCFIYGPDSPHTYSYRYTTRFLFPSRDFLLALEHKDKSIRSEVGKCAAHFLKSSVPQVIHDLSYPDSSSLRPYLKLRGMQV